jgi:hypothetical protein
MRTLNAKSRPCNGTSWLTPKVAIVKLTIPVAAILITASLALTGCSGGGGGGGENTSPPKPNNPAPAKTFTEDDLVKILNTANTTLSAGGSVTDIGLLSAHQGKSDDLYERIIAEGGSLTPAACGTLFDKINADVGTLGNNSGAYAARLDYGGNILSATSSSTPVDVSNITSLISGDLDALSTQCATANVTLKGLNANLTYTKNSEKTDAGTTYSYSENSTINGSPITVVAVIGVDGNLLIGFEGINGATLADGDKAVNAVVAAAASN